MENPLPYDEFLNFDQILANLIKRLEQVESAYKKMTDDVVADAKTMKAALEKAASSGALDDAALAQNTREVDKLTKAYNNYNTAMSETAKEIARLQQATREENRLSALAAKSVQAMEGSYDQLSAQYSVNRIAINKLSQEYLENTEAGQKLIKETNEIRQRMIKLQEATGNHTLSVGNYTKVWNGLGYSVSQVVRELPSLAINAQTFFLAISNNIPILVDELQRAKEVNKSAAKEGKAIVPVWKQVVKSLFSFNTVMVAVVTVLSLFGDEIIDFIAGLFKGKKSMDAAAVSAKNLQDAMADGVKSSSDEIVNLKLLYNASQDQNRSMEDRKAAIDELQRLYPSYLGNLSDEEIFAGNAATAYENLQEAIIAKAKAEAYANKIAENTLKIFEIQNSEQYRDIENAQRTIDLYKKRREELIEQSKNTTDRKESESLYNEALSAGYYVLELQKDIEKTGKTLNKNLEEEFGEGATYTSVIEGLTEANKKMTEQIDVSDLLSNVKGNTAGSGNVEKSINNKEAEEEFKKYLEALEEARKRRSQEQRELYLQTLKDEEKIELEKRKDEYEKEIQDINDIGKGIIDEEGKITEQLLLAKIDAEKQYNNDVEKIKEDFKDQRELNDMKRAEEELKWRLSIIKKGSDEEIEYIKELAELRKQIELKENSMSSTLKSEGLITRQSDQQLGSDLSASYAQRVQMQISQFEAVQLAANLLKKDRSEYRKNKTNITSRISSINALIGFDEQAVKDSSGAYQGMGEQALQGLLSERERLQDELKNNAWSMDIYDVLGLNMSDAEKTAVSTSTQYAMDALNQLTQARLQAAEAAVQAANTEVEAAQSRVDAEIEARNNGYANNVITAQKELDLARKNQRKALQEQAKAQRQQEAINALSQTSDLITATAGIWKTFPNPLIAVPMIAIMWASFAASKIKAMQMTRQNTETYGEGTVELLHGGSHASGRDVDLGTKPDGTRRRAEGGEFFAVINKRASRRYRHVFPQVIRSFNNCQFEEFCRNAYNADGLTVNTSFMDMRRIENDVRALREASDKQAKGHRFVTMPDGTVIEYYKNTKRIYKKPS